MKKSGLYALRPVSLLLVLLIGLTGCTKKGGGEDGIGVGTAHPALGASEATFGEALSELGVYDGYFEDNAENVTVTCVSGTADRYTLEGNTLTFSEMEEDSVYSVSGQLKGSIVIDVGDSRKFDLELCGLSLVSDSQNPILIRSGSEVSVTAKKDHKNYIYDMREAVSEEDENALSGAIHSEVDLEICGKGSLTVISENNKGIHTKDDLQVKNLTLFVACADNALKGNDSVSLESGACTLIATRGDGIKTSNSDISEKGKQRGVISVTGGTHTVYAACDGLDAAYDAVVEGEETSLTVYTDKYSNYSEEVTAVASDVYYIRYSGDSYRYSVKYYNSDTDYVWVNATHHSTVSGGRSSYYYYSFPRRSEYQKMQFFIYSSDMEQSQETEYLAATDYLTPNTGYDTFALVNSMNGLGYSWTNYTTSVSNGPGGMGGGPGGMGGGMQEGNSDKGDYSTKGIKAANRIQILGGTVTVKAYDDAIHANADTALENGETPAGSITVSGGVLTVYSNDDGLHADGALTVTGGTVRVVGSYEGLEGTTVALSGGQISVTSSDDGINATATSGTAIAISGGTLYIYAGGDGIDANSRSSYEGIVFSGGRTAVISTSGGNSAIDTEQGYRYTGGSVLAVMPSGGMTQEATSCQNFSDVGIQKSASLNAGEFLTVKDSGGTVVTVKLPKSLSGRIIYLGSSEAWLDTSKESDASFDGNGVCWY